jgi:citrate lyase subunit beta/citryl-CoA lyase
MAKTVRPRRSVLYMPGANTRALDKSRSLPADGLILDLEDSVAPDAKDAARQAVAAALAQGGYGGREVIVRVNHLESPWGRADVEMAATSGADAVLLPKVESGETVRQTETLLAAAGSPAAQRIWCMMETPLGILNARDIASASSRLDALVMGTSDLAKDLSAAHTRDRLPMLTSLGLCLLAARAYGLAILDGVHLDLNDEDGFIESCRQGRDMGFDGKTLIHPKTIAACNTAFTPSAGEIATAERVIAAHAAATAAGKGVVVVDGKLVERLHVEDAHNLMALTRAIAALDGRAD